ncbi:MAG: hypothetical protein LBC20_17300 [Planctomycetaceae bacterium]|jgi:hypothetical protein|nr:hypothetical protein [Planctomycetaceae bacterium]
MSCNISSHSEDSLVFPNGIDAEYLQFLEYRCALIAESVYKLIDLADAGMPAASPKQIQEIFGSSDVLFHEDNGFHAKLYCDIRSNQFILGFGGTTFDNINDWITNINQFLGQKSEHYIQGIELVNKIRDNYIDKIIVTGHSLGGGIATVTAITRKLNSYVFNPPAIHINTLEKLDCLNLTSAENRIKRFVVSGEILDLINKTISIQHRQIGTKIPLYGSGKISVFSGLLGRQFTKILVPNPVVTLISTIGIPLLQKSVHLHSMKEVFHGLKNHLSSFNHCNSSEEFLFESPRVRT